MELHPDFEIESYRSRTNSKTTVIVTHKPTGLVSLSPEQWTADFAYIDAWKGMAGLLAERLRHEPPQPPPASFP